MEDYLNSKEFYELMQQYRLAPQTDQDQTIKAFNNVKNGVLEAHNKAKQ